MSETNLHMQRVLICDARQRSALAATRALGRLGVEVITADESSPTLAGASRFSRASCVYPSPYTAPARFLDWFMLHAQQGIADIVFPMTEVTTDLLIRHRDQWPHIILPFADISIIDRLSDKMALMRRARELAIPTPASIPVLQAGDLDGLPNGISFPVVIKPYRSRIWLGDSWLPTSVRYARNRKELLSLTQSERYLREHPFLLQQYVPGSGQGVFAIYDRGTPLAFFSHRRLREKPPTGGVSVLSESCAPPPLLLLHARRLLDDVRWHGVAMVEFKVTEDGTPYLMEINARFWGSLQLSIDCGVNFPEMLYRLACGERPAPIANYPEGRRLRWWLGDLDRLYLALKASFPKQPRSALREIMAFSAPHFFNTRHEVFRWTDPSPAWFELKAYITDALT